jgi:hypothetical protein
MPRTAQLMLAGAVATAASSVTSHANVLVYAANCTPIPASAYQVINLGNNHYNVILDELYSPWNDSIFEIRPAAAGVTIDNLVVSINGPPAGSPVIIRIKSDCWGLGMRFLDIQNIIELGTSETLLTYLDIERDLGRVEIEAMGTMYVGRDVVGPIIGTTPDNPSRGINSIYVQRHVLGDLIAMQGTVGFITSVHGDLGTADKPINVLAKYRVHSLNSEAGDIYADVHTYVNNSPQPMSFFQARRFAGHIDAGWLSSGPGWSGEFRIHEQLNGQVVFRRGIYTPEVFKLPAGGINGQIILNADGDPTVGWTSPMLFHNAKGLLQFVISGPNYTVSSSQIGPGSIGIAPFGMHGSSCVPVHNGIYGPITLGGTAPVAISRRVSGTSGAYTPVPSTDFTYGVAANDPAMLVISETPGAVIGFDNGYQYRVLPQSSLLCAEVIGTLPVQVFEYRFNIVVTATCPSDLDCSGTVNGLDLASLLSSWGRCDGCAADLNHDGIVNGTDLAMILGSWGPCGGVAKR